MAKFKVGEVVYLNSGSPKLTVCDPSQGPFGLDITVSWIDNAGNIKRMGLPEECFTTVQS